MNNAARLHLIRQATLVAAAIWAADYCTHAAAGDDADLFPRELVTFHRPRRSFDLREQRLFDQLDAEQRQSTAGAHVALMTDLEGTEVTVSGTSWLINGKRTNAGTPCAGLLMNVRMVNATFEDQGQADFDGEKNTDEFISKLADYAAHGVNAVTLNLQGGMPGYEGAVNSAFNADGSLRAEYLRRVERVIRGCDQHGMAVILGLYYQRQSRILRDEAAVRAGVVNAVRWIQSRGFRNVVVEIANEYPHQGFAHQMIRGPRGQASLIRLAKATSPGLLVTASGLGDGSVHAEVAEACDFLTPHWNGTKVADIPARVAALKRFGKPIVCNEDDKTGQDAVAALRATVQSGAGYGLMLKDQNQTFPFHFEGAADDPIYYAALKDLATLLKL